MNAVRCIECDHQCVAECIDGESVLLSATPVAGGRFAVRAGRYVEVVKNSVPIAHKERFAKIHERDAVGLIRYADHRRQLCKKSFTPLPEALKNTRRTRVFNRDR